VDGSVNRLLQSRKANHEARNVILHHKGQLIDQQPTSSHGLASPNPILLTICPKEACVVAMPGKVIVLVPLASKKASLEQCLISWDQATKGYDLSSTWLLLVVAYKIKRYHSRPGLISSSDQSFCQRRLTRLLPGSSSTRQRRWLHMVKQSSTDIKKMALGNLALQVTNLTYHEDLPPEGDTLHGCSPVPIKVFAIDC
jgi:hypothetical protein